MNSNYNVMILHKKHDSRQKKMEIKGYFPYFLLQIHMNPRNTSLRIMLKS